MKKTLAAALIAVLSSCITPVFAGTTGTLSGHILDTTTKAPIAGARVEIVSPSQSATAFTDSAGGFTALSLAPDSYDVSVSKAGYDTQSQPGVTVFADQSSTLTFELHPAIKEIGSVRSQSSSGLVRAGTTSDVYSVDAAGQRAAQGLGGSGSLDQAYGAIASVPGVSIPTGQQGWYQSVFIRGGDYDQVAYEFDGVPVLRASDGAPIVTLSALGQQEVQVYTGGTPATSDSPGLAGYINQVIKTGTHPGYALFNAALGSPAFYHKLSVEAGGATPNRLFSYYIGIAGANQDYRYGTQANNAGDPLYFYPLVIPSNNASGFHVLDGSGGPGPTYGAIFSPGNSWAQSNNNDREAVANFHIGIPHHNDAGRDDVQLLYVTGNIFTKYFSSANQIGSAPNAYLDSTNYTGPLYSGLPDPTMLATGFFPSSPLQRSPGAPVPVNQADGGSNGYSVAKAQYQRNLNSHSYLRAIGYGEYSNWYLNGPNSAQQTYGATLADYEVYAHIFGGSLIYSNALSSKHLLTASLSASTQYLQTYNATFGTTGLGSVISNLVDPAGNCYNFGTGLYDSCYNAGIPATATTPFVPGSQGGLLTMTPGNAAINLTPGAPPPGSPAAINGAQFTMTENGQAAQVDNVRPYFSSVAVTDVMRPNDRWDINAGIRLDRFSYQRQNLAAGYPARAFWFAAYNREHCGAPGVADVLATIDPVTGLTTCPAGTTPVHYVNATGDTTTASVLQPRVAFTYLANRNTVLRGSYGRYARPAATSYQQYNTVEQNLPSFLGQFAALGYNSPNHDVRPDISDNFDFSYERNVPGSNLSFKVSPFYRTTKNQLQYLNISALGGTLAGVNVGTLKAYGIEFSMRAGDFNRDGLTAQLSYTYTNTKTHYGSFSNGVNVIDVLNRSIQQYNSYTSACAGAASTSALCGGGAYASNSAPSYAGVDQGGNPITIPNPYYGAAAQPLLDRNADYVPYDVIPGPFSSANSYSVPHVASLILNYKHKGLSVTPSLTYSSGGSYGSPLSWPGYVPQACSPPAGTPINPPGTPGINCGAGGLIFIPDKYTGRFDGLGSLKQPSQLTANLQLSYDIAKNQTLTLVATGLYNQCFQRGYAWDDKNTCVYSSLPSNILPPAGNFLDAPPPQLAYPYGNWFNNTQVGITSARQPFNMVLNYSIKI